MKRRKKEQQNKTNTWANKYIVKELSKIRNERKDKEKSEHCVHVATWRTHEKYDNKSIPLSNKLNNNTNEHEKRENKEDDSQLDIIST